MIQPPEMAPLTDFTQHTDEAIKRLKETGQPQVLTVDGRAEVVVQDVASYQRLLELVDRAEAIEGIRRGLESWKRGRADRRMRSLLSFSRATAFLTNRDLSRHHPAAGSRGSRSSISLDLPTIGAACERMGSRRKMSVRIAV